MDELSTGQISLSAILYFVLLTSLVLSLACQQMRGYYSSPKHPFVPPILGVVGLLFSAAFVGGAARGIENLDLKLMLLSTKNTRSDRGL